MADTTEETEEVTEETQETSVSTTDSLNEVIKLLATKLLSADESAEIKKIRKLLLLRSALETEVKATRIPLPQNITEIGGYYNLLADIEAKEAKATLSMQKQVISSALGLPTNFAPNMTDAIIAQILGSKE